MERLALTRGSGGVPIGPYLLRSERPRVLQVGIEGQQQRGPFLDQTDPGVLVTVDAALVPFGLFEPAFQVEVVLRQFRVFAPHKQAGGKAGHDVAHVLPHRVLTALQLLPQGVKALLPLITRATRRSEDGVDRPHVRHLLAHLLLCGLHDAQAPVDMAGQTGESVMGRPPFCASRFRWSDARTSPSAAAMRMPGGCSGPP